MYNHMATHVTGSMPLCSATASSSPESLIFSSTDASLVVKSLRRKDFFL